MPELVVTTKSRTWIDNKNCELVFSLCEIQGIEIVIIHKGEQPSFESELATDVLEIITVFSASLYGSRSKKNRRLMETLQLEADQIYDKLEKKLEKKE